MVERESLNLAILALEGKVSGLCYGSVVKKYHNTCSFSDFSKLLLVTYTKLLFLLLYI